MVILVVVVIPQGCKRRNVLDSGPGWQRYSCLSANWRMSLRSFYMRGSPEVFGPGLAIVDLHLLPDASHTESPKPCDR